MRVICVSFSPRSRGVTLVYAYIGKGAQYQGLAPRLNIVIKKDGLLEDSELLFEQPDNGDWLGDDLHVNTDFVLNSEVTWGC